MKVGLTCLICPREWTVDQQLENAKNTGYEAIELVIRDEGEITLNTSAADLQQVAARAADMGLEIAAVCPGFREDPKELLTNDDALRATSIDNVKRALDVTAGLGADTMLLTMGNLPADLFYNEAYANGLQSMHRLAPHAEQVGVNLAIEFVWTRFLISPLELATFCAQCASPRVGFYFDTGNMMLFGYPHHWARICGPYIMKVHVKDFKRQGYQWTPLLEGDVDFPAVMAELRKIGYDDALISEVGTGTASYEDTAAAIRKIREM